MDEHGDVFDLSNLMAGSHLALLMTPDATGSTTSYYLSVCSALNPIQDVLCPPMSTACMLEKGQQPKVCTYSASSPKYALILDGEDGLWLMVKLWEESSISDTLHNPNSLRHFG